MHRFPSITRTSLLLAVVLALGALAWAAPMMPQRRKVADKLRALAKLDRFALRIGSVSQELVALGFDAEAMHARWAATFRKHGFEIIDEDHGVPVVSVGIRTITEKAFPDAVAFCGVLAVRQPVTVDRLDQTMHLWTYNDYLLGLEHEDDVYAALVGVMDKMVRELCLRAATATESLRHWEDAVR